MTNISQKDHRSLLKSQYHLEETCVSAGPFITIKWCSGRQLVFKPAISLATHKPSSQSLDFAHVPHTETVTCYLISSHLWSIVLCGQTQVASVRRIFLFLKASVFLCCTKFENLHVLEWISLGSSYVLPPWLFLQPLPPDGSIIGLGKIPPELDQAWSRDDDLSSSILCTSHVGCLSKLL